MDWLATIPVSLTSLIILLMLPLVHFILQRRYWYNEKWLRFVDFGFLAFSICVAAMLSTRLMQGFGVLSIETRKLYFAHIIAVFVLGAFVRLRRGVSPKVIARYSQQGGGPNKKYSPKPINNEIQKLGWEDLIINPELREELMSLMQLLKDPRAAQSYGIEAPKGILLSGPPGTGKTTIAKVIANTAGFSLFVVSLDEIVSDWLGESEKNLTKLFEAARRKAPAIIFVDDLDGVGKPCLGTTRQWSDSLFNQFLCLIDRLSATEGLYLVAATNQPDRVDPALRRPGRITKEIVISLPDFSARKQLFEMYLQKLKLKAVVDPNYLASITEGRSVAAIKEVCNQAGLRAFKRGALSKERSHNVLLDDVEQALNELMYK